MPISIDNKSSTVRRPASATDNAVTRFDGTTGDLVQNSVVIISDVGAVTGVTVLDVDNIKVDGNAITSTNTNGNITITPNGTGSTVVAKLAITEGANALMGVATLVAGAATISTTAVAANSRIFLTEQEDGGSPGSVRVSARIPGTSFEIMSSSGGDTSVVAWMIITPA